MAQIISLIEELEKLMDVIDLDDIGMRSKIEEEVARYNKFRMSVLGASKKDRVATIDVRAHAKYLLREGTLEEKRRMLASMKNKLTLIGRTIHLH